MIGEAWTKCYGLKDKTNAQTNHFAATARTPVSVYQLARLGSPGPSRSHIGRRGAPDRISAVDCWRNRMARGKPRRTDGPSSLRSAAEAQAHPPAVSRREGGAHAGVHPGWSPTTESSSRDVVRQQYHFSPSGATEEIRYSVESEDVAALELTIIPNLSGGSYASLAQLRLA